MIDQSDCEFDLLLENTDDGYFCRVPRSPFGQASNRFQSPFSPRELDKFWKAIAECDPDDQPAAQALDGAVCEFGWRLFQAVFQASVHARFQASLEKAFANREMLRVRLDLAAVPELATLPWEFLSDPAGEEYLSLSIHSPFSRYTGLMHRVLPIKAPSPLRALVVIASPSSLPGMNVEQAWLDLLDTVDYLAADGKLVVEQLHKPTLLDLQRRLRQGEYHILHFIGHSMVDKETGEGQLWFEDEMGRGRLVSGEHLGALMRDHFSLRLILLSGLSGAAIQPGVNGYMSVAQSLVRRGVGAVVAPCFDLSQAAFLTFVRQFYAEIADFNPVDQAMVQARLVMQGEGHGIAWGAPALFMRIPDGRLFDDGTEVAPALSSEAASNIALRLSSLRIRTANWDTMANWSDDLSKPRKSTET